MTYRDVHEDLSNAQARHPVREKNRVLANDINKLRSALFDGLCDHVAVPEVSTDNGLAAHEVLGCPLYTGLLNIVTYSGEVPDEVGDAIRKVVVEAVTGMARRLITEGHDVLWKEYGRGHIVQPSE